jgi:hypothetical protein
MVLKKKYQEVIRSHKSWDRQYNGIEEKVCIFFLIPLYSLLRFTASYYLFVTFSLIPLYYLSLDLRLLITSLVPFLLYHCIVCPLIYSFWLPLWYFFFNTIVWSVPRFTASDYLFGTFSLIPFYCLSLALRLLITSLVLFLSYHCIVCLFKGQTIQWY